MTLWREIIFALALVVAVTLACSPAHALVTFNDSHDHIYVTGSFGMSRDSNVFANSDNQGDFVYNAGLTAEYTRRAGWIGVNGSVAVSASKFGKHTEQNFSNPSLSLELTKQSGRTTGSLTISGARESRADAAVNIRSTSWNFSPGLNLKYPAGSYTFTSALGYASRKYTNDTVFANLNTYTASLEAIHLLPAERELIGGYRYRFSETARNTSTTDHALTLGLSGRLLRGIMGSIRGGFQTRVPHGGLPGTPTFTSWTASGSTVYAINKKISLNFGLSKDFSITATDSSVDVTSATFSTAYAFNRRYSLSFSAGWGDSRSLGESGRIVLALGPPPVLGPQRHDNYANWTTSFDYSLNEHFKLGLSYNWFENWSTTSYADFIRTSESLSISSRW